MPMLIVALIEVERSDCDSKDDGGTADFADTAVLLDA